MQECVASKEEIVVQPQLVTHFRWQLQRYICIYCLCNESRDDSGNYGIKMNAIFDNTRPLNILTGGRVRVIRSNVKDTDILSAVIDGLASHVFYVTSDALVAIISCVQTLLPIDYSYSMLVLSCG